MSDDLTTFVRSVMVLAVWWLAVGTASGADLPKTRLTASAPSTWKPVPYQAFSPTGGVTLDDKGLFKPALENNINYLLKSFSVDHMLVPFRLRAGQKTPPDDRPQVAFWENELRGSCAGRFLMGAGNTLRWIDNAELRRRMDELIDGIEACRGPGGYILAYPSDKPVSEEPNYARAWFTHGLIEAGIAGNKKAYSLLRGHADWFNQWDLLPKLLYWNNNSHQGHIASTRTYLSAIGKPEDLQVAEKYYVCDWWLEQLAARREEAVWKYPLQNPHSYLVTSFEAYLDHYLATGDKRFLDATLGAWDLIHDKWEHVGGAMAICEGKPYPPGSYYISRQCSGETCGSVFWIKFNQRFHQLFPMEERYAAEIEKSIYNVCLASQDGSRGIRYHEMLEGFRGGGEAQNTCCEGQGTRLLASLPEYIYSTAKDRLYVNLYEPSTISWQLGGRPVQVTMSGRFPLEPEVALRVSAPGPVAMKLRVRVPGWAAKDIPIQVNGHQEAVGRPGSFVVLDRTWADGNTVRFTLPMGFRVTRYAGADQVAGHERHAVQYGPVLLALVGPSGRGTPAQIAHDPARPQDWLKPKPDRPLCFAVDGDAEHRYVPYYQLTAGELYTCYPIVDRVSIEGDAFFLTSAQVKIVSHVKADEIRYTLDGAEPAPQAAIYAGPIRLGRTATVKALAFSSGRPVAEATVATFQKVPLFPPAIRPSADGKTLAILAAPPFLQAEIHCTLDGTEPAPDSPRYTVPLAMPAEKTVVRARAIVPGETASTVVSYVVGSGGNPWPLPDAYLSDLQPLKATTGWGTVQKDRCVGGKPLRFLGKEYNKGMGVHAHSELVYEVKPEYRRFVALACIDENTQSFGSAVFEVYADEQLIAQTPVLLPRQAWPLDLPLPAGTHRLRLVVSDGGDGNMYDQGDWLQAGFVTRR